jgi:catechol 2,3-dioxygenase-like lactoylglutathione lyase family enzyme
MRFTEVVPVLRMFDEEATRRFYVDFLGFTVDWEHRFEPGLPLYMSVSREGCVLHLTGHHGDATPGSAVRIMTAHLEALQGELIAKQYKHARPGITTQPWGRDMPIKDPSGNQLIFAAPLRD